MLDTDICTVYHFGRFVKKKQFILQKINDSVAFNGPAHQNNGPRSAARSKEILR